MALFPNLDAKSALEDVQSKFCPDGPAPTIMPSKADLFCAFTGQRKVLLANLQQLDQ